MKKILCFLVLLLAFEGCRKGCDTYRDIEVTPSGRIEIVRGEAFHGTFTFSAPVYVWKIHATKHKKGEEVEFEIGETVEIPREYTAYGVRIYAHSLQEIEVWIDAEQEYERFWVDLEPQTFMLEVGLYQWVDNLVFEYVDEVE